MSPLPVHRFECNCPGQAASADFEAANRFGRLSAAAAEKARAEALAAEAKGK